jgi:hypothetical protein
MKRKYLFFKHRKSAHFLIVYHLQDMIGGFSYQTTYLHVLNSAASTAATHHAKECGMQYCNSAALLLRAAQHEWHMGIHRRKHDNETKLLCLKNLTTSAYFYFILYTLQGFS